jgi:hypothetical protein
LKFKFVPSSLALLCIVLIGLSWTQKEPGPLYTGQYPCFPRCPAHFCS